MTYRLNGRSTAHPDISVGTYFRGKFTPYGSSQDVKAEIDHGASKELIEMAQHGQQLHGSYKEGNFRPAEANRRGYISELQTPQGVLGFNYDGELINQKGKIVGFVKGNGEMLNMEEYRKWFKKNADTVVHKLSSFHDPNTRPGFEFVEEEIALCEKQIYDNLLRVGRKIGISENQLRKYGERLSTYDKDIVKRADIKGGLEKRFLNGIVGLAGIGLGIFFLSANITGNVIGSMTEVSSNLSGSILFIIGLVNAYFYFKR